MEEWKIENACPAQWMESMKEKVCLLAAGFLLIAFGLSAQDMTSRPYLTISYFGVLATHPGIKIGVQYPVHTFNRRDVATNLNQVIGAANLLLYFHRRNHIGAGANLEFGFRSKKMGGTNKEIFLGLGYLRTMRPNITYDFDQPSPMQKRRFTGAGHWIKTAAIGLGRSMDGDVFADSWAVKPTLMYVKPYNTRSTLNFALDAGYQFRL